MDSVLFCLQQIKSLSIHLLSPEAYRGLLFTQKHRGAGWGRDFPLPQEAPVFGFVQAYTQPLLDEDGGEREVKTDSLRRGEEQLRS